MTPWESLALGALLLLQESYLLYINSDYKNLGYKIYTTILKNHMQAALDRSSHLRCSVRKVALRNSAKFTGKHLFQSLYFNKVAGLGPETLLK